MADLPSLGLQPTKTKRPASLIEAGALLIIIVLGFWFFVRPKSAALSVQQQNLVVQKQQYDKIAQDKADLESLVLKLHSSKADVALVDEGLPLNARPTQIEYLLESLVQTSGMKLVDMAATPDPKLVVAGNKAVSQTFDASRQLVTTTVQVNVSGNVDQFKNLLQLIESSGRVLDLASMDITNDQGGVTFKLKLKSYSYAPQ